MVNVHVKCVEENCGRSAVLHPYFLLTKLGTYRLQGYANGWTIDGSGARCPQHQPDPLPRAQTEPWTNHDLRIAEELVEEERRAGR